MPGYAATHVHPVMLDIQKTCSYIMPHIEVPLVNRTEQHVGVAAPANVNISVHFVTVLHGMEIYLEI